MKPVEELIKLTQDEYVTALRLRCDPEFVISWRPRKHWRTQKIENGVEPSAGFIVAALAILH